ncbi:hypothetical protein W911_06405 [Hyphomicrobium nitrativorans NL23]|uniref:Uncharacterized protein n=1 Tax=Hyphomicrobium nitrativorans NL23 TaxID=1029756 RepID=V5SHR5_9HYPH|nr:hypothetical protein W911_06405 [Hyphomicrobium nitrativorans NL23]
MLAVNAILVSPAAAQELELIGSARTTHQTASLTFRLSPGQSRLSEIRVRSGSLALHLEAVEIVFADGSLQRALVQESLGPGHQSRPIGIRNRQAVREIHISKRPGMRPGETVIQILGRPAR